METIFSTLTRAVEQTPLLAAGAAVAWGILSIMLSPCHLASIPLIVGFIGEQGAISTRRASIIALLFSLGILITITFVGVITAAMGRMLGDVGSSGNYVLAAIFFLVGLHLMGVFPLPWSGSRKVTAPKQGFLPALILGLLFGTAVGPCTFAYLAPMLAVTFRVAASNLPYGLLLLVLYGIGHCAVIVLAGTFTEVVGRYLHWNEKSKGLLVLKRVCGFLILLGGLYMLYTA